MSATIAQRTARAALASQTQVLKQNLQKPIPAPRIALERKISIRFPHFQGFLTQTSSNISITGMFIRARFPQRPGTILDFEFNLHDGLKLIRGTGEVIWVRRKDDGDLPAGMGIRFLRLDAESRRLIRWAVEKQIDDGVEPFDLDGVRENAGEGEAAAGSDRGEDAPRPPAPGPAMFGDSGKAHPYAGYAVAQRAPLPRWLQAAGAGGLLIAALAAASFLRPDTAGSPAAAQPPAVAEAPAPTVVGRASAATDAGRAAEAAEARLIDVAEAWARAWGEQRAEDYLSFYSARFSPPGSLSRSQWEAQRRIRLRKPDFIQVGIRGLEAELLSGESARLTFDQAYRSDNYRDTTRKTLELVIEDGGWKIVGERSGA